MSESSLITSYKHDTQQQFADSVSSQLGDHPNDCRSPCLEGDGGGIDCFLSARVGRLRAEVLESPLLVVRFEWRGSGSFVSLYWRALEALNDLKSEIVLMQPV